VKRLRLHARGITVLALLAGAAAFASAQSPGRPSLDSIRLPSGLSAETADLAIRGSLGEGSPVLLDLATIMSFPAYSFTSIDGWDGKTHKYTGALLEDVMSRIGMAASATRITVTAKNKYTIPIRRSDYEKYGYLLAWKIDDHLFGDEPATRNRGKLAIAIDFASHADLDPQVFKHQLVWQVNDILAE
jgi:hypothetical protein